MNKNRKDPVWIFFVIIVLLPLLRLGTVIFSITTYKGTLLFLLASFSLIGLLLYIYKYFSKS